jgi:protein-S-isoprenylcysteine O-methyltransferase Ste14
MALIVAVAATTAIGLMALVRRRSRVDHFFVEVERGAGIFAFLGTAFAVLLAFVVLAAFQSFNDAKTGAEEEATTLVQMSRTAEFFPPPQRDPIEGVLICYGRAVVHEEWPAMKEGTRSPVVQGWVTRLEEGLQQLHPGTPAQEAAFLQLLEQQDKRTDARRVRLSEANRALPAPVWFILGLGAIVTVGFALFFADRREAFIVQGSLIGAIAALVVAGLLLIWFLDHPYENRSGSIKPDEMERQLVIVEAEQVGAPQLCDTGGQAL